MLRPATAADLESVVTLGLAEETAWFGAAESSRAEIAEYLGFHGGLGAGHVVADAGRVRGFVLVAANGESLLFADPADPDPPYAPLVERLLALGGTHLEFSSADAGRAAWFTGHGWRHARSVFDLTRPGRDPVEAPAWPAGVEVTAFRPGEDDAAVHALVYEDAAYAEVPGHLHRDLATWRQMFGDHARGWVARSGGRPVGWVVGRLQDDGRGWVNQIAVARPNRGTGLGRALLLHVCADLLAAGATALGLNVVAANANAIGLYHSVGFGVSREWQVYTPPLPPAATQAMRSTAT